MVATAEKQRRWAGEWRLVAILDAAMRSHARVVALLLAVSLACFLPGFFSIPPIDRDEARFAQATKQMVETGDYVDIRFQDEVRYKKPVGIYWLQALVVNTASALAGERAATTMWLYRVPSLIGAIGAVLLTYWTALAFVSRRAAVLAALMMASCVLLGVERLLAKTDSMLLLTVTAAMGAMARAYLAGEPGPSDRAAPWGLAAIFWSALAAGILLKGPLIIMIVGLAAGTLMIIDRSWRWMLSLRPAAGLVWCALLVLPWFLAIAGRAGDTFLSESVGRDLLSKVLAGQESHGAPPGFYFALFWVTFWPGATLAALAAPAVWTARREPATRLLLAWLLPAWIVFELVVTKLPHYVLPLYPAIAILIADVIDARMLSRKPFLVWGMVWWFVMPLVTGIGGIVALAVIGRQFGLLVWPLIGGAAVMSFLAWRFYAVDGAEHSLLRAIAAAVLTAVAVFAFIVPALAPLFPSPALVRIMRESGCPRPLAAAVGYQEPSLVFLAGTDTRLTDVIGAVELMRGGDCRFALVETRHQMAFAQRAEAVGLRYDSVGRVEGYNISKGQAVTIVVFRARSPM
jgi:4-amino-4-deoxy-L-arabinose transferase-like glycosyltransferase